MAEWLTTREIGIDAGHRVPDHGSKCRNLHGHRYRVQAVVHGQLHEAGEQAGMTLDFGFIKEIMLAHIDEPCDHGLILSVDDPILPNFLPKDVRSALDYPWLGSWSTPEAAFGVDDGRFGKLYVIGDTPTAENLARHWFARMEPNIWRRANGRAYLAQVVVWETPNCCAAYPAAPSKGRNQP